MCTLLHGLSSSACDNETHEIHHEIHNETHNNTEIRRANFNRTNYHYVSS